MKKVTVEELLAKARRPGELALKYHPFYRGKLQVMPKCTIRDLKDFAIWYTPGVAEVCKAIKQDNEAVYSCTNKWNYVAVVSDCTRVLGLGDIGPEAGLPVMEGKALLFKYLGGVDAFPICLGTKDPDQIITACKWLEPTFGGINLEDIESPKCFYVLDRMRRELEIPVWHDDQQGTAAVTLAGLINALKVVGKKIDQVLISMIGIGAANTSIARVIVAAGVKPENLIISDSKGILHPGRKDVEAKKNTNPWKWNLCLTTNAEGRVGGIASAMKDTDVCIAASKPGPGVINKENVASMADDSVIFAMANPIPEIWPWEAKEAGARIVATGRSDFPNQINNSLGFPGIFRGALDVRARTITDEMCIAAAKELAKCAEDKGLRNDYIVPSMGEWEIYPREATAVGMKAIEQGVARIKMSKSELYKRAETIIQRAKEATQLLMRENNIRSPPAE